MRKTLAPPNGNAGVSRKVGYLKTNPVIDEDWKIYTGEDDQPVLGYGNLMKSLFEAAEEQDEVEADEQEQKENGDQRNAGEDEQEEAIEPANENVVDSDDDLANMLAEGPIEPPPHVRLPAIALGNADEADVQQTLKELHNIRTKSTSSSVGTTTALMEPAKPGTAQDSVDAVTVRSKQPDGSVAEEVLVAKPGVSELAARNAFLAQPPQTKKKPAKKGKAGKAETAKEDELEIVPIVRTPENWKLGTPILVDFEDYPLWGAIVVEKNENEQTVKVLTLDDGSLRIVPYLSCRDYEKAELMASINSWEDGNVQLHAKKAASNFVVYAARKDIEANTQKKVKVIEERIARYEKREAARLARLATQEVATAAKAVVQATEKVDQAVKKRKAGNQAGPSKSSKKKK